MIRPQTIRADDPRLFRRKVNEMISYRLQNGSSLTRDFFMRIETANGKEYTEKLKAAFIVEWEKLKGEQND